MAPSLRLCDNCGSKMPPGTPRRRDSDGILKCPACLGRPSGGGVYAEAAVANDAEDRSNFPTTECSRCDGSGHYSYNQVDGTRCYGCGGTGRSYPKPVKPIVSEWHDAIRHDKHPTVSRLRPGDQVLHHLGSRSEKGDRWVKVSSVEPTDEPCGWSGPDKKPVVFYHHVTLEDGRQVKLAGNQLIRRRSSITKEPYVRRAWDAMDASKKKGSLQSEHLANPADGSLDWHHGSPHSFESFDRSDEDDEPDDRDYDAIPEVHWNSHLGQHWTSLKDTAKSFARGMYHNLRGAEEGQVYTANLGIKNPKHYASEHDMDREALRGAWGRHDAHDPDGEHASHCNNPDCYGFEEHTAGDAVDRKVKRYYDSPHAAAHWVSSHPDSEGIAWDFKRKLQSQGHDGITYGNEVEGPKGHTCAITFDASQVHNLRRRPWTEAKLASSVCPDCGGQEEKHLRADTMYHSSPRGNRTGIGQGGLGMQYDAGEGYTEPGVYLSPRPSSSPHEDVWKVDTRGLRLHPDDPAQMREFQDVGGSYFVNHDIEPERLSLHHQTSARLAASATGQDGLGRGSWVTPKGEWIDIPDGTEHENSLPASYTREWRGSALSRYMDDTHHARVRISHGQMNVQIAHPLTGPQRERLLMEADKNEKFSVGVRHPAFYEEGPGSTADKILARAHNWVRRTRDSGKRAKLAAWDNYKHVVQWVPIHELKRLREWDRDPHASPEEWSKREWHEKPFSAADPAYLDKLTKDIAKNGPQSPMILRYGKEDRRAILGEGNHRLVAAERLGMTHWPTRVWRVSRCPEGKPVPGHIERLDNHGRPMHLNEDLKPSDIGLTGLDENPHSAAKLAAAIGENDPERYGGDEYVPRPFGETPVAPGMVRAYHYTGGGDEALHSILHHGLKLDRARGHTYGEPDMAWGSTRKPESYDERHMVEFHVPAEDVSSAAETPDLWRYKKDDHEGRQAEIDRFNSGYHHVGVMRDIRPDEIKTYNKPWHHTYHALMQDYSDPKGDPHQFDNLLESPDHAPAIKAWKHKVFGLKSEGAKLSVRCQTCGQDHERFNDSPRMIENMHAEHAERAANQPPKVTNYCPEHAPRDQRPLGSDDAKLTCSVCGATGYHVKRYPMPKLAVSATGQREGDERHFGDYTMRYHSPEMGSSLHTITVHHPNAAPSWAIPFNRSDPTMVGKLQWNARGIHAIDVAGPHQRNGVASAMWGWGQTMTPRPKHSDDRTEDGDAWARSVGGPLPRRKAVEHGVLHLAMSPVEREAAEESEDNVWDGSPNKLPANAAPGADDTDRVRSRKGRAVPGVGDHVAVYRDLSGAPKSGFEPHDAFSVKRASPGGGRKPLVVAHTTGVHLTNVRPVYDEAARQKAMETGKRGVHAYQHGQVHHYIDPDEPAPKRSAGWHEVNYYPDLGHFFLPQKGRKCFHGADEAVFHHGKMYARGHIQTGEEMPMSQYESRRSTGVLGRLFRRHAWVPEDAGIIAKAGSQYDPIRTVALMTIAHDSGDGETIYHCGRGSERYWTYDGLKTLGETVGTVQKVLVNTGSGGVWRDAVIHSFGEQKLLKVTLRRNQQVKVTYWTPEHRWLVRTRQDPTRAESRVVVTADLKPGDPLAWTLPKSAIARSQPSTFGIAHGIVFGDGVQTTQGCVVRLWGEKDAQLLRYFNDSITFPEKTHNGVEGVRVCNLPNGWKERPSLDQSTSYLYGWLAGYFAADGCVSKQGQVILHSANRENLEFAQLVATRLGIGTYDIKTQMRRGYGAEPSALHRIEFMRATLRPDFFLVLDHKLRYTAAIERGNSERIGWTVESVEDEGLIEEVFCPRVEGENFVLDGWINTLNCPFCGSGQVIGRSDGTVECQFCQTHFTVQVQPEFAAMPQTIDGQPQQVPGMPSGPDQFDDTGDEDADAEALGEPDQPALDDDGTQSPADQDAGAAESDGGDQPPWLKGSARMYLTAEGGVLPEEAYMRHLAIKFGDDPEVVLDEVRSGRG